MKPQKFMIQICIEETPSQLASNDQILNIKGQTTLDVSPFAIMQVEQNMVPVSFVNEPYFTSLPQPSNLQ